MAVLPSCPTVTEMEALAAMQRQRIDMLMAQNMAQQAMQGNQLAQYQAMQNALQMHQFPLNQLTRYQAMTTGACTGMSSTSPAWAASTAASYNQLPPVPPITKTFAPVNPVARVYTEGENRGQPETTASAAHRESRDAVRRRRQKAHPQEEIKRPQHHAQITWDDEPKSKPFKLSYKNSPLFGAPKIFGLYWTPGPSFAAMRRWFERKALRWIHA